MSIITAIQCEVCEQTAQLGQDAQIVPAGWRVLLEGFQEDKHFCSLACLKKHLGIGEPTQPLEQPQTKMRRFLLVDGETADEFEGILWGNGCVALTPQNVGYLQNRTWTTWDSFKRDNPGCGVTWIDQEVSDAS